MSVDGRMASALRGSPPGLYRAAAHLIRHGGKRLRPRMAEASAQVFGGSARQAAAAVEMIHNFTLIHDDIMDNDERRHGVPSVHKKYGQPLAILAGDVLFSKAFEQIASAGTPARAAESARRLARACVEVCEGQALDMAMAESPRLPSVNQYLGMVGKKTAALFEVSCALGAIAGGARARGTEDMAAFGRNLGVAFQITDDLIGVLGDPRKTGKPVGNDLREGKKSLPVIAALGRADRRQKKAIAGCLGDRRASRARIGEALGAMREMGIEEEMRSRAGRCADAARARLAGKSGRGASALLAALDLAVRRDF